MHANPSNVAQIGASSRSVPDAVLLTLGCGLLGATGAGLLGLPCPIRLVTGLECPLCGSTRMGEALLHGDFTAAFAANPFAFVVLPVLTYLLAVWSLDRLPAVRAGASLPLVSRLRALRRLLPAPGRRGATRLGILVLAAGLAFMAVRNLL